MSQPAKHSSVKTFNFTLPKGGGKSFQPDKFTQKAIQIQFHVLEH